MLLSYALISSFCIFLICSIALHHHRVGIVSNFLSLVEVSELVPARALAWFLGVWLKEWLEDFLFAKFKWRNQWEE